MKCNTLREAIAHNQSKTCDYCREKHRKSLSKLCGRCAAYLSFFGHPGARPVRISRLRPYIEQTNRLIRVNGHDHPAIAHWLTFCQKWLERARVSPASVPGGKWLSAYGDEFPLNILRIGGGVWNYNAYHHHPTLLREPACALFMIGKFIAHYQPIGDKNSPRQWLRSKAAERREIVEYLRVHLAPLLEGFRKAIEAEQQAEKDAREMLSTPLEFKPFDLEKENA